LVIEPFAGSMGYTLYHRPKAALGIERDSRVVALWQRLVVQLGPLVEPRLGERTDDLLVKLCAYSNASLVVADMLVTERMLREFKLAVKRLERDRPYAATLAYQWGSYADAPDVEATWFIDPPYQKPSGRRYVSLLPDYAELAGWVRSRRGQVIVCEQAGADWMPFRPLCDVQSLNNKVSREVVWTTPGDEPPVLYEQLNWLDV
jgi:hypothetical protein